MTNDKFNDSLNALLKEGRINHVINVLRKNCASGLGQHPDLVRVDNAVAQLSETYNRLREFMISGLPDPGRTDVYESVKAGLRAEARNYLFITNEDRPDSFFAEYRLQKIRNRSLTELLADYSKVGYHLEMALETGADPLPFQRKREELLEAIFRKVWVLPPWAASEREELSGSLKEDETPFELKSQIVSALLLGLLRFYDPAKFMLLIEAYEDQADERLEARILMAIVLVLDRWNKSAVAEPAVKEGLERIADSILTYTRLRDIVMTIIRTHDTDRVSREVKDAFTSTMKEISPEMLERLQRDGMAIDSAETGMNPEWEKLMKNKELEEKMQALNDMQLEGMDVMMQTFARLKSFGFFRSVSNWFLPFSASHSETAGLFKVFDREGFLAMADATEMCDGDRYSFVLGIMQMPEEKRNLLSAGIGASLEQIRDHLKDKFSIRRKSEFVTEALSFARDLYRFAKLFPRNRDFYDPFERPVDFLNIPVLSGLLKEEEVIGKAADFYFHHGYYAQALNLYEKVVAEGEAARGLFEKLGYCCQMTGDYASALENYEKADLFSTDADRSSSWLLKKLALCNKALGFYGQAAEFYRKLLEQNPDNLKLEFQLGSVLLRSGDVTEGKQLISKVHYLDPDYAPCARLYSRLKGHEAFISGNFAEALAFYKAARGEQELPLFHRDLIKEMEHLYPSADITALKILLDRND